MSNSDETGDLIRRRAETCQKIVDEALENGIEIDEFLNKLRSAGATPSEAADFGQQYTDRLEENRAGTSTQASDPQLRVREATPEGLNEIQQSAFRETRERELVEAAAGANRAREEAVVTAAWKVLEAKLKKVRNNSKTPSRLGSDLQVRLAELLGDDESSEPLGFPASVLDAAPHLKDLPSPSFDDPHLGQTWRLKRAYEKAIDNVIDGMRGQEIAQPLPRSIWKTIIEDRYVDFEKLFAGMDPNYDPNDESKDFGGGFALIKKDHASAKHPIHNESEWNRVFVAWKDGVTILYPHRESELRGYLKIVNDVFRAAPRDPFAAINFDAEVRKRYENSPYRLDDRNQVQLPLLTQMFNAGARSGSGKRNFVPSSSTGNPAKRSAVICLNWNFGTCEDPCNNRRKHGSCSECGGQHRARDSNSCFILLQTRRGKANRGGISESSGGSSGKA